MAGRRWFCEFAVPGTAELLMCGGSVCGKRERSREVLVINQAAGRVGAKSGELGHAARCRLASWVAPLFPHSQANPISSCQRPPRAQTPSQTPSLSDSYRRLPVQSVNNTNKSGTHTIGTTTQHGSKSHTGRKRGNNG